MKIYAQLLTYSITFIVLCGLVGRPVRTGPKVPGARILNDVKAKRYFGIIFSTRQQWKFKLFDFLDMRLCLYLLILICIYDFIFVLLYKFELSNEGRRILTFLHKKSNGKK